MKMIICLTICILFSCSNNDKKIVDNSLRNELAVRQFVKGKLTIQNALELGEFTNITFDSLQSVVVNSCINMFADLENFYNIDANSFSCNSSVGRMHIYTEKYNNTFLFQDRVCTQALYSCVGYKLLELAELQSEINLVGRGTELDTRKVPFAENNHFSNYLSYNAANEISYRTSFTVVNENTSEEISEASGQTINCDDSATNHLPCEFNITIGPQEPHIRTWLYQAARDAFERAGIAGGQVLFDVDGIDAVTNTSQKKAFSEHPTFAEQFATEYFEVLERYTETVEKLAKHQASVGAMDSQWTDATRQQQTLWNAAENSRLAGIKSLLNDNPADPDGNQARSLQCPTCSRKIKGNGIQRAVDFLRAGRSPLVFDDSKTVEAILQDTVSWLLWDRDGGDTLPTPTSEDAVTYIRAFDFGIPEVEQAVDILREEKAAFFRVYATSEPVSGSSRIVSLMPPTSNLPAAFWQGRLQGMETPDLESEGVSNATWFKTTQAVHPHRSAHEFIQYMRDGALQAVNAFTNFDSEVSKLYGKLLVMGTRQAGDMRLILQRTGINGRRVRVTLQGRFSNNPTSGVEERLLLVRDRKLDASDDDNSGLWCALEGKIGGVTCNLESDYLTDSSNFIIEGDDITGSPFEDAIRVAGSSISGTYHVILEKAGKRSLIFSFTPLAVTTTEVIYPIGGTLLDDVSELVDRDPEQCAEPTTHCTGLPMNLVPPLENELTSDSDLYETSWRHYLNLATLAANEADQLGQQLVEEGLQMDMRAEEAALELEGICGNVVNVGDITEEGSTLLGAFNSSDASLENCLPSDNDTIPMVSIGPALCLWSQSIDNWCECNSPIGEGCPKNCPMVRLETETCNDVLRVAGLAPENFRHLEINDRLQIVDAVDSVEKRTSSDDDQTVIREMRASYEAGEGISDTDWDTLKSMPWFNQKFFSDLVLSVRLNPDPFYHYNLMIGNGAHWSTHKALNSPTIIEDNTFYMNCPLRIPWRPASLDNSQIICESANYDPNVESVYGVSFDGRNFVETEFREAVRERILWGSRINDILKTASLLGNRPGGFVYARRGKRGKSHGTFKNRMAYSGFPYYSVPFGSNEYTVDEDGRNCIDLKIPTYTMNYPIHIIDNLNYQHAPIMVDLFQDLIHCGEVDYSESQIIQCHQSNFSFGSSLGNCSYSSDSSSDYRHFDDYYRHDGLEFNHELYQNANELWNLNNSKGIHAILRHRTNSGNIMNADVRGPDCVEPVGYLTISQNYGGDVSVPMCLDGDRLWDALEFAAYYARQMEPTCLDVQGLESLNIASEDDLFRVSTYLRCASTEVMEKIQRTILYNLPRKIVEKMGAGGNGQYAGVQGELLQAYMEIENALTEFTGTLKSIPEITFQMSQQVRATTLNIKGIEIIGKIEILQSKIALWNSTISMTGSYIKAFEEGLRQDWASSITSIISGAMQARILQLQHQIMDLQGQRTENQVDIELNSLVTALGTSVSQLRQTLDTLKIKANQVNQALERLNQLRNKAEVLAARATMAGSDAAGRVYPTNTVMRRRYNTTRIRYENALERAKKLAYIARRAIEFRLGEDLTEMTQDMTLVPAPSAWVEDVCTVTGMDYSAIRDEDDPMTDYSGQFIGDYVKKLSDVVESYSFDYPFHDSEDVAVISLRDDIKTSVGTCLVDSHNHLVYSGDLGFGQELDHGSVFGWKRSLDVCAPTTDTVMHPDEVCTWVRKDPTIYLKGTDNRTIDASSVTEGDWVPSEILNATMVMDATGFYVENTEGVMVAQARTSGSKYKGFVQQTTQVLSSGDWMLSLWYMPLKESIPGKVEIYNDDWQRITTVELSDVMGPWRKAYVPFNLSSAGVVHVQIHASLDDTEVSNPGAGAVAVWGVQLELLKPGMCIGTDCITREYQATDARRLVHVAGCIDTTGSSFRQQFRRGCACLNSNSCTNESEDIQCYWETDFVLNLADIESGKYLTSDAIAVGNYNYRHGSVALNVVGSQILSCPEGGTYQCYANGYVPYTLYHDGEVSIRNHGGWTEDFSMNQARIEHGKALAAEVVVTNPLSSQHQSLLSGFDKKEFRGRPLQGQYTLRIWETPGLQWQNLEDIQLIWRYTYWTAF